MGRADKTVAFSCSGMNVDYSGDTRTDDLDLAHHDMDGYLSLDDATVDGRIDLHSTDIGGDAYMTALDAEQGINAWNSAVHGDIDISGSVLGDLTLRSAAIDGTLAGNEATITGDIDLKRSAVDRVYFTDLDMDGTLYLGETDMRYLDLRGATIPQLWVDDLDAYTLQTDDDTWIGDIREGHGLPDDPALTDREQSLVNNIGNRPRFPVDAYEGAVFAYDDLGYNIVMDAERQGLFGSLVEKGVIRPVDDDRYALVSRQYRH